MYAKRNCTALWLVTLFVLSSLTAQAQQKIWTPNDENPAEITAARSVSRQSFPKDFKLFDLDIEPLRQQLFSIVDNAGRASAVITLPNADGALEYFELFEASNFEPDLQAQFPQIRAFSGRGISDRYATVKLSISPQGIQTIVFRTDAENEFIESYSQDRNTYAVFRRPRRSGTSPWECTTDSTSLFSNTESKAPYASRPDSNTGQVRTVRLAQSCNGEYANFFGATSASQVDLVLAAFNATMTRVNGVNEKDLAIHFNLIASTTSVIYYDPATDPYTSLGSWNSQLQTTLTANIGEANYDIGHMFGASGGGGNAGCIGCVCVDGSKGKGITSPADSIPMGDNFDIDYVVHEMGHQLGANHSFSHTLESSGNNKEVGSGITIMGYAGITGFDVAPHSIDTFHATNIQQIQTNLANKTCPVTTTMTANHPPVVAAVSNVTIPISTPFSLTGSATDPDDDAITYQWEQNDNATTSGGNSVASPGKLTGPNWLSFPATSSPTRTFPRMSTILSGLFVTPRLPGGDSVANIEALSSVARTLNFRLTVRDNHPYIAGSTTGQTQFTDTTVTVTSSSGPFKVTSPNTGVSYPGGSSQSVTWDVANTTAAPVSVSSVKISYSSDGGTTFPTVLSANTANDGSETVTIPEGATTQGRIKIEALGNIFFDISDANFTVTGLAPPARSRADFDGDGKTDLSVFRPSEGNWYLNRSTAGFVALHWGASTDNLIPGDYDNDGKADTAIFRPSADPAQSDFYILNSNGFTVTGLSWGTTGDVAVPADYDGDGKTDPAVYRASTNTWYALKSAGGFTADVFGVAGDVPMTMDTNADGKAQIAVFRSSNNTWYIAKPTGAPGTNFDAVPFGALGDRLVPADYDGDSKDDIAVYRPSNGTWYVLKSSGGTLIAAFGIATDVPVPGDYDGDGSDDLAVYRNGIWYVSRSTAGILIQPFGLASDVPIASKYVP
ncbi:MAG TPA: zinc-dependent metalloprotease family protein [Pyrinomonadaceae bacterium]|nr:zinc-dependent metalloprotease family protein [Pyrinomonadaceae bacterium]